MSVQSNSVQSNNLQSNNLQSNNVESYNVESNNVESKNVQSNVNLQTVVNQRTTRSDGAIQYHSEQAMVAARKMRSTRQKQKTGQMVCHHLRMMLSADPSMKVTTLNNAAVNGGVINGPAIKPSFSTPIAVMGVKTVGEPANDQPQYQLGI